MSRKVLEAPLTIEEVGEMIGKPYHVVRRTLMRIHSELGGTLLVNIGGEGNGARWTVTKAALKRACPDWFENTKPARQDIEELRSRIRILELQMSSVLAHIRDSQKAA